MSKACLLFLLWRLCSAKCASHFSSWKDSVSISERDKTRKTEGILPEQFAFTCLLPLETMPVKSTRKSRHYHENGKMEPTSHNALETVGERSPIFRRGTREHLTRRLIAEFKTRWNMKRCDPSTVHVPITFSTNFRN